MYDDDDELLEDEETESFEQGNDDNIEDGSYVEAAPQGQAVQPQKTEKERNNENNAKNVRNAADVAIASKNPYAMAVGGAVKAADKVTGGKASEAIGKGVSRANKYSPFGRKMQKNSNRLAESGASDKIGQAAALKNGNATGNSAASTATNMASSSDSEKPKISVVKALKNPVTRKIIIVLLPVLLILFLIMYIAAILDDDDGEGGGMATAGYYAMRCEEVNVIFTDKKNGYEVTGTGTYPLEEYVAGVVAGEVAYLGSIEVDKEFAIAARSYFLTHDEDCTIESSDRRQVFRELTDSPTDQMARQAAEETKGQVLLKDNQIYGTEYDAFCSIEVDENYYTISQANQKIPRSWVDSQRGIAEEWKQGTCAGNHGRGLSQFGSLYLANEKDYKYPELLAFYLGDEFTISSGSGFMTSIPGLEIKDTTNSKELHEKLTTYLSSNGTSIDEMNNFIRSNVESNGVGTREGVVTAAVSLVNYLYDGLGVRIPYYWGGQYQYVGVNPSFGGATSPSTTPGGNVYNYTGLDCSGFASWAIRNGGYNFSRHTTHNFHSEFAGDSCNITDRNCIGQPGDLINSASCHVQMIVSVDEDSGKYYIVESTGGYGLIMHQWSMHTSNCGNQETRIIHMDNFYNNKANVDTNY